MELKQITAKIQVKFNQYSKKHVKGFSLPVQKFIRQSQFGILKSGTVQLNNIGRALQEKIPIKKTTKRLGYHLGSADFWYQITEASLDVQQSYLQQCKYLILDLSDIQKEYAEQMDGLAIVCMTAAKVSKAQAIGYAMSLVLMPLAH